LPLDARPSKDLHHSMTGKLKASHMPKWRPGLSKLKFIIFQGIMIQKGAIVFDKVGWNNKRKHMPFWNIIKKYLYISNS
jgi:hypothetical protein